MKRWIQLWVLLAALSVFLSCSSAHCQTTSATNFTLPSGLPSGDVVNDQIWVTFFQAKGAPFPAPAVVLVHPLGEVRNRIMDVFGRYLAGHGISAASVILPYHMKRLPKGENSLDRFVGTDIDKVMRSYEQSAADLRVVTDWLARQPNVDSHKLGIIGVSLGAILTHLEMGRDPRLVAGVAILG